MGLTRRYDFANKLDENALDDKAMAQLRGLRRRTTEDEVTDQA
jgi:hypothetical protein